MAFRLWKKTEKSWRNLIKSHRTRREKIWSTGYVHSGSLIVNKRVDLLALCRREERDIIQKTKLTWLKLGNKNMSFFHRSHRGRKKKKRSLIPKLVNNQGNPTTLFFEIEHLILDFYSTLYEKSPHTSVFYWSVVSANQNKRLISKFSLVEIRAALKSMGRNRGSRSG